ncbi:MAG: hypothetical protein ACRBBW_02050 [Cellvibrionaceae bacterium]
MNNWTQWCLTALVMLSFPVWAASGVQAEAINGLGIKNLKQPADQVWVAGQPNREQIEQLGKTGVTHVINLRPEAETDWQEDTLLEAQGIVFHRLPVSGIADLNYSKAAELDRLLTSLKGEKVLVHCASGNRVGGLVALQALAEGATEARAIEKGKAWGLTRLEARVRQIAATEKAEDACSQVAC